MSKRLEQYFYLVLGSTLLTLGIWLFVTPNQINFGGMIGLAQLIDYFIHKFLVLPKSLNTLGMINLLMNIPLFKLRLHGNMMCMCILHYFFGQCDILLKRQLTTIDHNR